MALSRQHWRYYDETGAQVHVAGVTGVAHAMAYSGDSSCASVVVANGGGSSSVRSAGSEFELSADGIDLLISSDTTSIGDVCRGPRMAHLGGERR